MTSKNELVEIGDEIHNLFKDAPRPLTSRVESPTEADEEEFEAEDLGDDDDPGTMTDFDDELKRLIDDDTDGGGDVCDDALGRLVNQIIAAKSVDLGRATGVIYDVLADLIEEGLAENMPETDDEPGVKARWIANTVPKVRERLVNRGILPAGGATGV